jgi:hypothetical protein
METVHTSETSGTFHQSKRRPIPEDKNLHSTAVRTLTVAYIVVLFISKSSSGT